ncbi:juvenile hormone epoxide hydrolase-like [Maniola hyperantus]|uniref:juvenile hormone epoxide hydrolase-like n=1 Tax=Aphantopus hyperantus TaxID=2795564 RepID=UPI00156991A5|nr:juvenile hormone epoxide hydrolase-like isoform X1 [Maniola hyperantus]
MFKNFALFVAFAAVGVGIGTKYYQLQSVPDLPELDLERWWGDGDKPKQEDKSIRPFKIVFNDSMIEDLKSRLKNRRSYIRPMDGTQSEYGINTIYLENILKYWLKDYNFKERAERLNRFPHFKTKIQGLDIHYIRVKPEVKNVKVLPLLLMHGWPSSSKEFDMAIPMLTKPRRGYDFVFEVVAVDLPGFGFSEGTNKPGLNPLQIGIIMRNLMKRLGFNKYYIQAGDWGSQAGTHLATVFQDEVLGFHTNMPVSSRPISNLKYVIGSLFPSFIVEDQHRHRMYPIKDLFSYLMRESGYFHLQATKPDTIGAALADTPAGLAAYTLEKIGICSNRDTLQTPHGGLEEINIDDLLDTVTILWANERITMSMRVYAEAFAWPEVFVVHDIPTYVPTAAINFQYEVVYQPDWILRDKFPNLVHSTTLDFGGHFAAMHTPKELVDDVFESVVEFIKFHSRNSSK